MNPDDVLSELSQLESEHGIKTWFDLTDAAECAPDAPLKHILTRLEARRIHVSPAAARALEEILE